MSALLVNRGRQHNSRRSRVHNGAPAKVVPLRDLFAAVGGLKKNPLVANRGRRHNRRHNPLVANRGRGRRNPGSMSRGARAKMSVLAQVRPRNRLGQFLPLRSNRGRGRRHNPLVANRGRGRGRRHNPLVANRGRGRGRRHNPLVANRGRRHNPLVANRGRRHNRRRNPAYGMHYRNNPFDSFLSPIAGMLNGIPVVGPMLSAGVMALGGAAAGAIGILPVHYALHYGARWIPERVKPFAYTIAGAILSGVVRVLGRNMPMAHELSIAMAAGGGAVDVFRKLSGASGTLAGDDGWGGEMGYDETDMGADELAGDDGFGDDPNVRPAEWADASLMDAQYSDADLSDEERHFAGLGRRAFRRRYLPRARASGRMTEDDVLDLESDYPNAGDELGAGGAPPPSRHAGRPGRRWGWLIFMIGPANFAALSKLDAAKRRQIIHRARHAAMKVAQRALQTGVTDGSTRMDSMEAAGLLSAA